MPGIKKIATVHSVLTAFTAAKFCFYFSKVTLASGANAWVIATFSSLVMDLMC